jgi:hypothetical protein
MAGNSKRRAVHRCYTIVTELTSYWNTSTMFYDAYLSGKSKMDDWELVRLIQVLKEMRRMSRAAIDEIKSLRQ